MPLSIIWIQETLKTIRIMKNFTIIWNLKLSVLSHLCRRGHHAPQFSPTKSTTALQKLTEDFFHRLAVPCIVKEKPGECIHTIHVVQNSNIQITVTDTALESAADNCTAEVVHLHLSALLRGITAQLISPHKTAQCCQDQFSQRCTDPRSCTQGCWRSWMVSS